MSLPASHPPATGDDAGLPTPAPSIGALVDARPVGTRQVAIVLLCFLAQLVDGFDTQAAAFVAPALSAHWHLAPGAMAPVFAAAAFGTLIGSLAIGPLGDLVGRKTVLVGSLLLAAAAMLSTPLVRTLDALIALRFVTGLPLGAIIPMTIVMANEWSPTHRRGTMVTLMTAGFALGAIIGGLTSAALLPRFGWPSVFVAGAAGTLAVAGAIALAMPESLHFLSLRPTPRRRRRLAAALAGLGVDPATPLAAPVPQRSARHLVPALFRDRRASRTALLWTAFFMNMLVLNCMTYWLPSLLTQIGLSQAAAIRTSTFFQMGGILGIVGIGILADRVGVWRMILLAYLLSGAAVTAIGLVAAGASPLLAVPIAAAGFCVIGTQMSLSAAAATLYPPEIRSTGLGWALGIGRFGSTAGPLVGGALIGWQLAIPVIFGSVALFSLAGAATALMLARVVARGRG